MCRHGSDKPVLVMTDPTLAHDGVAAWRVKLVDACLAHLVFALNQAGRYTSNCCCGHGKAPGWIAFHDGTELTLPIATLEPESLLTGLP